MSRAEGAEGRRRWRAGLQTLLLFFLMLRVGIAPSLDLDPTWSEVLGWAHARGLKAGVDYVFTYGPLGFLYPLAGYFPGAAKVFLNAQIVLALGQAIVVGIALRRTSAWVSSAAIAIFAIWLPWLAGDLQWYATFAFAFVLASDGDDLAPALRIVLLAVVSLLLAAIALIKFTSTVVFILWICAVATMYLVRRRHAAAIAIVACSAGAYLLLWHLSGQPLATWPLYMRASFEVASGYTAAMGQADDNVGLGIAILSFVMCAVLIVATLARDRAWPAAQVGGIFLLGLLAVVWRAGATRYGHWPIFFGFAALLPLCAICLRRAVPAWQGIAISVWSLLSSLLLLGAVHSSPALVLAEAKSIFSDSARALFQRKSFVVSRKNQWLAFERSVDLPRIRAAIGEESVDVLMTEQGLALAMGLHYYPRPVFQSYSAYTPELARRNEAHFAGLNAPKFVILKMQPLDERLPLQEDGLALVMLLKRYRPRLVEAGYLLLERGAGVAAQEQMPDETDLERARLGGDIPVNAPHVRMMLFADVRPTLSGRLHALLLREPALAIAIMTRGGMVKRYRLLRATARSGFLLSPLLISANDWLTLDARSDDDVASFRIEALDGADRDSFEEEFRYALVPLPDPIAITDKSAFADAAPYSLFSDSASDQSRAFDMIEENGEPVLSMHAPAWIEFSLDPGSFSASGVVGIRDAARLDGNCAQADGVDVSMTVTENARPPLRLWGSRIDPPSAAADRGGTAFSTPKFTLARHALVRLSIDPRTSNVCDWSYVGKLRFRRESD